MLKAERLQATRRLMPGRERLMWCPCGRKGTKVFPSGHWLALFVLGPDVRCLALDSGELARHNQGPGKEDGIVPVGGTTRLRM